MRSRRSSIRFKILLPLLVPLVSLAALWAFAAGTTLGDGLDLSHVRTISEHFGYPSGSLTSALQAERRQSLTYLGSGAPDARATLDSQRIHTDQQSELFHSLVTDPDARSVAGSLTLRRTDEALRRLSTLSKLRAAVNGRHVDRDKAYATYTGLITALNEIQSSLSTLSDPSVARETRSVVALTQAREALAEEDSVVSGVLAAGHMSAGDHIRITQLAGAQRRLYQTASGDLSGPDRAYYDHITGTEVATRLRSMENRLMARSRPGHVRISPVQWKVTADSVNTRMRGLELSANARADQLSAPVAQGILWRIAGAGVLGLIALVASIWLSVRAATSVVRELRSLRDSALELANERLPSLISRLRRNDDVDAAAEAPPLAFRTQEINAVGDAFNTARRTAIDSAVGEARLRRGISEIFVNLARRSQTLIHRQLTLLDTMENRVTDPEELQDLFRIDHLSTRMRRHAEGLIILSGSAPGRGWRNPVPVIDVVRGAASEVEDYARVKVQAMPTVSLSGSAVADVIHLLAELIENATQFSPPHTPVRVVGEPVGNGFVIEVEDRGLSMTGETLEAANEMLAEPPPFDLISSARLGHFVVGRLAGRHGIRVSLRTSPYGGTTAIVLLPPSLIADTAEPEHGTGAGPDTGSLDAALVAVTTGDVRADDARPTFPDVPRPMHAPETVRGPRDEYGPPDMADPWSTEPLMPKTNGVDPEMPVWGAVDGFPSGPLPAFPPEDTPEPVEPARDLDPGPSVPAAREPEPADPPDPGPAGGPRPSAPSHAPPGRLDDGRPRLPRRVPQTSISPELLERTNGDEPKDTGDRSPEEVRTRLSSIQRGWQRGRSEAELRDAAPDSSTDEEHDR